MSKINSQVTAQEAQEILDKHNCARKRYALKPLVWNWELAAHAQEHADRCIWEHASKIGLGVPGEGENLSLAMNRPVGVDGWLAEEKNYDCPSGRCTPATVCGHWTQMAWVNTGQVGCGKKRCASLEKAPGFVNSDILVCRYTPPGNYVGQPMANSTQCESGATNKSCGNLINTPIESQPKPTTEKIQLPFKNNEKKVSVVDNSTLFTSNGSTSNGSTSNISTSNDSIANDSIANDSNSNDNFSMEQQRIARLQKVNTVSSNYDPRTQPPRFSFETIETVPEEKDVKSFTSPVPVSPDPNTFGYPTAEEAIETRKNFSRNIIIAISVIILIMLAIITFFSYRYRKVIKKIYDESKEKLAKKMKGNFID